jgi:hypothetical protein
MLILVLLPGSFSKIYSHAESLKEGSLVASVLASLLLMLCGQSIKLRRARQLLRVLGVVLIIVASHSLLMILEDGFNLSRFVLSLAYFGALVILWLPIVEAIFSSTATDLDIALRWCYWILLSDGLASTVLYRLGASNKTMFFAAEPSHFALAFLPFLFYILFRDRSPWHLAIAIAIAIFIGNVTLLAGVALLVIFYYRRRARSLIFVCCLGVLLISASVEYSKYLIERMTFSADSENLTTLVFISGYERAYETLTKGQWLGVGFQQMGFAGPSGSVMESITALTQGSELNLYDGGTLASKLIVEFGVLGIGLLIYYLVRLVRLFRFGRFEGKEPLALFLSGVFITFACYVFMRGMGYFSITVFLFLLANSFLDADGSVRRRITFGFGR